MSHDQEKFEKALKQGLDQSVDALDDETLSRLRQARANAVEAVDQKADFQWNPFGNPIGGAVAFASVAMLAVAVWVAVPSGDRIEMAATDNFDDMELIVSAQELEFYEDIEFYYWLEVQQEQSQEQQG